MSLISSYTPVLGSELAALSIILIFCLVVSFSLGKGKIIALILSFYPAVFFYSQFPIIEKLVFLKENQWQIFFNRLILFAIFFILTFLVISIIAGGRVLYTDRSQKLKIFILSICVFVLTLLTIHQIIPLPEALKYMPKSGDFFASDKYFFWLILSPLAIILLFIRK